MRIGVFILTICAFPTLTIQAQQASSMSISPDEAIHLLKEGNRRFAANAPQNPDRDKERRRLTASKGERPFATVLACSDSRVPVEILFDRGIGDIFVVRVAGNVAGVYDVGSMEL